jgi:DNA-binding transcriptional LysR family regulator
MDTIKLMESYAAVVKLGSFSKAAREVGATRAMISKRIRALEDSLSVKLLNRNTHGLSLTAAGTDYYENCVSLLAGLKNLNERMQDKRTAPRGELKILSTKTFSETVLGPIVAEFCSQYPEVAVQITLFDRDRESYGTHLVSGGFDMAVVTFPVGDSSFIARPIGKLSTVLVASPRYLKRAGTPRTPADLVAHNCLDPSGARLPAWEFDGPNGRETVRVSGTLRTNGTLIVRHAALEGLGIGVLREYLVADHIRRKALVKLLGNYHMDERSVYLVYQRDTYQPLRMRIFADHVAKRMKHLGSVQAARSVASPRKAAAKP